MKRVKVAIDTSALVSLAVGDVLPLLTEYFDMVSTGRVRDELREIASIQDTTGEAARLVLNKQLVMFVELPKDQAHDLGEVEVVHLTNRDKDIEAVIMDDVRASKKLKYKCKCPILFSPTMVYFLCEAGKISRANGWKIIQKMSKERTWKESVTFQHALQLWEEES